jgi:hypothetical protein
MGLEGILSKRKDSAYRSGTRLAQNEELERACREA